MRVLTHVLVFVAAAFVLLVSFAPASAEEPTLDPVVPLPLTAEVSEKRQEFYSASQPELTSELLQAYVDRRQQLQSFDAFDVPAPAPELTQEVLMGYIARRQNQALDAIEAADISDRPALTADVLSS
jgi:hypothetical protein